MDTSHTYDIILTEVFPLFEDQGNKDSDVERKSVSLPYVHSLISFLILTMQLVLCRALRKGEMQSGYLFEFTLDVNFECPPIVHLSFCLLRGHRRKRLTVRSRHQRHTVSLSLSTPLG